MTSIQIAAYLGCTRQAIYYMAEKYNWKKKGEHYQVTEYDLYYIKNNPSKRGRKFGCKVFHQTKSGASKEIFSASALESVW